MRIVVTVACAVFALVPLAIATDQTQSFPTSAGPVKITPLNHASTLIEAGGKTIYLENPGDKPAKLTGLPKADLILITDIHGDHMDPASIQKSARVIRRFWRRLRLSRPSPAPSRSLMGKRKRGKHGPLRRFPLTT